MFKKLYDLPRLVVVVKRLKDVMIGFKSSDQSRSTAQLVSYYLYYPSIKNYKTYVPA